MKEYESMSDTTRELSRERIIDALGTVRSVFRQFRSTILERAGNTAYIEKQDEGPVTESDREIEETLKAELQRLYPEIAAFGEEGGYEGDTDESMPSTYWLIDPIDGTKSFIEGTPAFTCMAVLIGEVDGTRTAIAAEIYNPTLDIGYSAVLGEGAYKSIYDEDGVEHREKIELLSTPMPTVGYCKGQFIEPINSMLQSQGVICEEAPAGGGFGFTEVLESHAAARFNLHPGGHTHDYAPGALLVREAGGKLWPIRDDPNVSFEARSFIACHPDLIFTVEQMEEIRSWEKPLIAA